MGDPDRDRYSLRPWGPLPIGRRCPARIRVFLLTLVIVDDIGALTVVALGYTDDVSPNALLMAVGLFGLILLLRRAGVGHGVPYFLVSLGVWLATLVSGLHPRPRNRVRSGGGKIIGITGATWLATRPSLGGFPLTVPWPPLVGAATVAGIGFTVSLLIADITFAGADLEVAKIGIFAASILAALLVWVVFRAIEHLPRARTGGPAVTEAIVDLADPVDPEVDHMRGPAEAPVTLVEYGDFQCPYCGLAEPVIRQLLARFGAVLRFVFRHLPLVDVHENAQLAAEAAEAAHVQGRFWEMHDLLFAHQDALGTDNLPRYAAELGLDTDRFSDDLRTRRHATRVTRDVDSADRSGVVGTPTFFINGRRHQERYDLETL